MSCLLPKFPFGHISGVAGLLSLLHDVSTHMASTSSFLPRHIGPTESDQSEMLKKVCRGPLF